MKKSKTYIKICENRQAQKTVAFRVLRKLLESYGFVFKPAKGSHWIYECFIDNEKLSGVLPNQKPLKRNYVIKACEFIAEKIEYERGKSDGNDTD